MADYIVVSPKVAQYLKLCADKNVEERMAEQLMAETQKKEEEYRKLEEYYAGCEESDDDSKILA